MKKSIPQFDLPGQADVFNLAGEKIKTPAPVDAPRVDTQTPDLFPPTVEACGFKAFGFMPPCVLEKEHTGDHADGFGGHYGRTDGMSLEQVPGSKEIRYTPPQCPTHKVPSVYYDGCLGYESYVCPVCHWDINDAKAEQTNNERKNETENR